MTPARWLLCALLLACGETSGRKGPTADTSAPTTTTTTGTGSTTTPTVPDEVCDGIDNDGDGLIDDADDSLRADSGIQLHVDADGDGHGGPGTVWRCEPGPGFTDEHTDCDDTDPAAYPGAIEWCDGRDNDCDGAVDRDDDDHDLSQCGWRPTVEGAADRALERVRYNPCVLDPSIVLLCDAEGETHDNARRAHRIAWPSDGRVRRELFVFLPPGVGDDSRRIPELAAQAGYRSISLGHFNNLPLRDACDPPNPDPHGCYAGARHEVCFGEDRSDFLSVSPADSVAGRLHTLLGFLHAEHPEVGWDAFVDGDAVRWEDVVLAGWSTGAENAAYCAAHVPVAGMALWDGPQDSYAEADGSRHALDWLSEPRVSPPCTHVGFTHTGGPGWRVEIGWELLGMDGLRFDIDTGPPPLDAQRLVSALEVEGCTRHALIGNDRCIPDAFIPAYIHVLARAAEVSAETCD